MSKKERIDEAKVLFDQMFKSNEGEITMELHKVTSTDLINGLQWGTEKTTMEFENEGRKLKLTIS